MTKDRYLVEAQRNGLYSEDMDPEVEVAAADAETPDLVGLMVDDTDEADDVEDDGGPDGSGMNEDNANGTAGTQ